MMNRYSRKTVFLIFFLIAGCSSVSRYAYNYDVYTFLDAYPARASEKSVESGSEVQKRTTCCDAALLGAKYALIKRTSEARLSYSETGLKIDFSSTNRLAFSPDTKCRSRKNQFEECYCVLDDKIQSPDLQKELENAKTDKGWISPNTFLITASGKASSNAAERRSGAMMETTCISAAEDTAIRAVLEDVIRKTKTESFSDVYFRLPHSYVKSCEPDPDSKEFDKCTCRFAFFEKGLYSRIEKAVTQKPLDRK
ncbi:MAG TPA: hypothetical protein PKV80_03530 [Leptospiraceae bacterium]|nr:hypothetical protein [Leptospiraceae bacterium]